jgi:hypothetical protein
MKTLKGGLSKVSQSLTGITTLTRMSVRFYSNKIFQNHSGYKYAIGLRKPILRQIIMPLKIYTRKGQGIGFFGPRNGLNGSTLSHALFGYMAYLVLERLFWRLILLKKSVKCVVDLRTAGLRAFISIVIMVTIRMNQLHYSAG